MVPLLLALQCHAHFLELLHVLHVGGFLPSAYVVLFQLPAQSLLLVFEFFCLEIIRAHVRENKQTIVLMRVAVHK